MIHIQTFLAVQNKNIILLQVEGEHSVVNILLTLILVVRNLHNLKPGIMMESYLLVTVLLCHILVVTSSMHHIPLRRTSSIQHHTTSGQYTSPDSVFKNIKGTSDEGYYIQVYIGTPPQEVRKHD